MEALSTEHKENIGKALRGRIFSEEHRRKISEAKRGQTHSQKTKEKMSNSHSGIALSETHRKHISEKQIGKKHSQETKEKISKSRKGKQTGPRGLRTLYGGDLECKARYGYPVSAKQRGLTFELTLDETRKLLVSPCYYCGKCVTTLLNGRVIHFNGIDRVDNNKGYEKTNVVSCCKLCNYAKSNRTQEEFLSWVQRIYLFNFSKEHMPRQVDEDTKSFSHLLSNDECISHEQVLLTSIQQHQDDIEILKQSHQ